MDIGLIYVLHTMGNMKLGGLQEAQGTGGWGSQGDAGRL